ncbi:unnamed protein product [Cunninghamella blakesleeana]
MGCCQSNEVHNGKARNEEIENQIKRDKINMKNEVKMLLLGAGESGKSTILKQMKLIHDGGYSRDEREAFKEIIFSNTIQSMRVIIEAMESMGVPFADTSPIMQNHATIILDLPSQIEKEYLPQEVTQAVKTLWKDSNLLTVFDRSHQDVLRSRVKTTGITETTFVIDDLTYRMFDVGGQRSERKKWIHCFENVTAIIFLVAISEYDQVLIEDETVNRMQEALTLFDSICNSRWFVRTSIILFLNKIDIFKEKLPKHPLRESFPDFTGPETYDSASDYILNRFVSLNQSDSKQVYTHFTCATDTEQIKFVMAAVNDIIIQNNLRDVGLL